MSVLESLLSTPDTQETTCVLISNTPIFHKAFCICRKHNLLQNLIKGESFIATCCHSLHHYCHLLTFVVPLVFIRFHSLSFVVTYYTIRCNSLSLLVTRCITRLSLYKKSHLINVSVKSIKKLCKPKEIFSNFFKKIWSCTMWSSLFLSFVKEQKIQKDQKLVFQKNRQKIQTCTNPL